MIKGNVNLLKVILTLFLKEQKKLRKITRFQTAEQLLSHSGKSFSICQKY
jgi:hypothetical protein